MPLGPNIRLKTIRFLKEYYQMEEMNAERRVPKDWTAENKLGFFVGIATFGQLHHVEDLHRMLCDGSFGGQDEICLLNFQPHLGQPTFISEMLDYYIHNFQSGYRQSASNLFEANDCHYVSLGQHLVEVAQHKKKYCVVCWNKNSGSTILRHPSAKIQLTPSVASISLCNACNWFFQNLYIYIDTLDGHYVAREVQSDSKDTFLERCMFSRSFRKKTFCLDWMVQLKGELILHLENDTKLSEEAKETIKLHKAACLIWDMAGGVEEEH